jgi:hypothetical protein
LGHAGKFDNALGDGLPNSDTGRVVRERESAYLLGDVSRCISAMELQHLVGASPQFPIADHDCEIP